MKTKILLVFLGLTSGFAAGHLLTKKSSIIYATPKEVIQNIMESVCKNGHGKFKYNFFDRPTCVKDGENYSWEYIRGGFYRRGLEKL